MKISQTDFKSQSGHKYLVEMAVFSIQRAITSNVGNPELWFMYSALLYIYVKFHENNSDGFQLTEQT